MKASGGARARRRASGSAGVSPPDLHASELRLGGERFLVLSFALGDATGGDAEPALTPAEREILDLLLAGRTDEQIARARRTKARTVAKQVASLYRKLGVSGRRQLLARR